MKKQEDPSRWPEIVLLLVVLGVCFLGFVGVYWGAYETGFLY